MHIWKKKETTIFLCILINLAKWTILNSLWRESQTLFMKSLWVFCSFFSSFLFVCFFFNEKNNYAVITTREIPHTTGLKSFSGMYKTQFALLPFLNLEPPSVWSSQENLTITLTGPTSPLKGAVPLPPPLQCHHLGSGLSTLAAVGPQSDRKGLRKLSEGAGGGLGGNNTTPSDAASTQDSAAPRCLSQFSSQC